MEVKHNNRIRMFKATNTVLEENRSLWNGMPPFVSAVELLTDKLAAIDLTARKQQTATAGAALDRAAARERLEDVLFLATEALGVLAHNMGDNTLLDLSDVRPSALQRMTDEQLANHSQSIVAQASSRTAELATLQVTEANLTELSQALATFIQTKSAPRAAIANRMAQTDSLPELISDANQILRSQIDRMVSLFQRSHPEFVAAYRAARLIVDLPATHKVEVVPKPPVSPVT